VRIGPVAAIPALLRQLADEPAERIIAAAGLEPAVFDDPENSISFADIGRLYALAVEHTGMESFGLLVGQQAAPASLGQIAELAVYAPNAGAALYGMILHICINDRGGVPTLTVKDGRAKLGYAVYVPVTEGVSQIYGTSLAVICNLLRGVCGPNWVAEEVRFSHSRPADTRPYESFFKAPVVFDAEEDAVVFAEHWLRQPLPGADPQLHEQTLERLARIEIGLGIGFEEELRSLLRPLIVSQCCNPGHLAKLMSLHPRTLNRRLEASGTTLRKIVGEIRYEMARQFLADSGMSLIRISTILGYADASVFTRAFRRWSGMTPSAWRQRHAQR